MIINHNLMAMNAHRQLGMNQAGSAKSMEKLSSGFRINRAGDDAAGLAISEKMRGQIRGLKQAQRNAQDGISMIQTAEGALNETHSILQRMRELANQAANDTNVAIDRDEIQKEINALTSEINRIGNTTEFNTQKLLNGGGVDPTRTTGVSSNGLDIPKTGFQGGTGDHTTAVVPSSTQIDTVDIGDVDGEQFVLNIEGREFTFKFVETATANEAVSTTRQGDTFTLRGNGTGATATLIAGELESQINQLLTSEGLTDYYEVSVANVNEVTVAAKTVDLKSDNTLEGRLNGGNVTSFSTALTTANTAADGTHAAVHLDFSNTSTEQLKGSELMIGNQRIAFFDSADGKYEGTADISIDLNGARNTEQIIDRIVEYFGDNPLQDIAAGDDDFETDLLFTKADGNTLQITAAQHGADGNRLVIGNLAEVEVTQVYGNARLSGEGVVSAFGLDDGEHTVKITHLGKEAMVTGATGGVQNLPVTIDSDSDLAEGVYKLVSTGTNNQVELQKQNSDGSWSVLDTNTASNGQFSFTVAGDTISIDVENYTADDFGTTLGKDSITFTVSNAFQVQLREAGADRDDWGEAVRVQNGQTNVTLNPKDGIGPVTVNIGSWDPSQFEYDVDGNGDPNSTISWSFETQKAQTTEGLESGQFSANFQIGANTAQSMTITIDDMRAQALGVSGTVAGGNASTKVENASFVATANVTNGTDNVEVEYALDVSTHEKATAALTVINDAIETVSAERSKLGAFQNRLEHTINNLGTSAENLQAAESRIRDLDMAEEIMAFTKNNILQQAATAMLAQANMAPQSVLQLLG